MIGWIPQKLILKKKKKTNILPLLYCVMSRKQFQSLLKLLINQIKLTN